MCNVGPIPLGKGKILPVKKETGELLDQRVHVVTTTQEIHHRTRNFVYLPGDYLGDEGPLSQAMAIWSHGHVTLTASSGNTKRPLQETPFFGLGFRG